MGSGRGRGRSSRGRGGGGGQAHAGRGPVLSPVDFYLYASEQFKLEGCPAQISPPRDPNALSRLTMHDRSTLGDIIAWFAAMAIFEPSARLVMFQATNQDKSWLADYAHANHPQILIDTVELKPNNRCTQYTLDPRMVPAQLPPEVIAAAEEAVSSAVPPPPAPKPQPPARPPLVDDRTPSSSAPSTGPSSSAGPVDVLKAAGAAKLDKEQQPTPEQPKDSTQDSKQPTAPAAAEDVSQEAATPAQEPAEAAAAAPAARQTAQAAASRAGEAVAQAASQVKEAASAAANKAQGVAKDVAAAATSSGETAQVNGVATAPAAAGELEQWSSWFDPVWWQAAVRGDSGPKVQAFAIGGAAAAVVTVLGVVLGVVLKGKRKS